jgi:hypothetical protein
MTKKNVTRAILAGALLVSPVLSALSASASIYSPVSATLSDSQPNASGATYTADVSNSTSATIKCISVSFNDAANGSGSKPSGMDISNIVVSSSSGVTGISGWTASRNNATGVATFSDASGATGSLSQVAFGSITNGSTIETAYFMILKAYTNSNCSSGLTDSGTTVFMYENGASVTANLDPVTTLSIGGMNSGDSCNGAVTNVSTTASVIPFGTVDASGTKIGAQNLQLGTNAANGVNVYAFISTNLRDDATGAHNINNLNTQSGGAPAAFPAPGTEGFGYTTSAANSAKFNFGDNRFATNKWSGFGTSLDTNEKVFSSSMPTSSTQSNGSGSTYAGGNFCVGYQLGVGSYTPAGAYSTTVDYVVAPRF